MIGKRFTLLALALCLGMMSACGDNTADTDIMSESEEITTDVPETQAITEGITEEPTDVQPYVKPEFTQYTSESHISELPSESDYTVCELVESCHKTVLGYNAKCEKLKYQTPDGLYMWYTVCTDTATDTVFYQGRGTVTDLNGDGDNEIRTGDYLLINTSDGIMEANIQAAFDSYLKSALPADSEYDFSVGCDGSLIVFAYTVYGQNEGVFEEHYFQMRLAGDRFEFGDEYSYYRDIYAPFDSNDPNWSVEVSLTEVADLGKSEYSPALYTLTFYGPEDKQFSIYEDNSFLENCSMIYTDQYQDAHSERQLIVHPSYDYAILLYPYANQTADDPDKTIAALIDLNAGCIVSSRSDMEEAAFSLSNPYYLFRSAEEALEEYRKYDFMGISIHSILLDVEITDTGFEITASLPTANSDSTVSNSFSIDLVSISQSVQ